MSRLLTTTFIYRNVTIYLRVFQDLLDSGPTFLLAFDVTTGATAWDMKPDSNISALSLCEQTEKMVVATEDGNIFGLNMHTGEKEYAAYGIKYPIYMGRELVRIPQCPNSQYPLILKSRIMLNFYKNYLCCLMPQNQIKNYILSKIFQT